MLIPSILGLVIGGGIYVTIIERHWIDWTNVNLPVPFLPPSLQGFKIGLFSDIHLGFFFDPCRLNKVVKRMNRNKPDMICFTGDLVDSESSLKSLNKAVPVLKQMHAPYGKFAVLGNHDYRSGEKEVRQALEDGGFVVLRNHHVLVEKGADRLFVAGLDDALEGQTDLDQAMAGIPEGELVILLVHEPDVALTSDSHPITLQVSGHSHGGQVRVPLIGPIITTEMGKRYTSGLSQARHWPVYTSRGLGTTVLPVRFWCRPEITFIRLEIKR